MPERLTIQTSDATVDMEQQKASPACMKVIFELSQSVGMTMILAGNIDTRKHQ